MKLKTRLLQIALITLFFILIFNPKASFDGASAGLKLWATTVLPGLFPAMIISTAILKLIPMHPSYRYIYIIICGLFCGYPLGAILCGQIHKSNPNEKVCEKIMPYCNISSPSFVVNYIMLMSCFEHINPLTVLLITYLPAIEALTVILILNRKEIFLSSELTSTTLNQTDIPPQFATVLDASLIQSVKNALKLGGYITIFACISSIINTFMQTSAATKAVISGITEITNGIFMCNELCIDNDFKIILILTINAFGGISTIMQTMGMIKDTGLSIKKYIYHKLLFAVLTTANALLVIYVL